MLAACSMKQEFGEDITVRDYGTNEKPSAQVVEKMVNKDDKATKKARKDRPDRHAIDKTRNALDDMGYAVGDKLGELFGSSKSWEPKLVEFHSMKITSKATQRHGDVSITLSPMNKSPVNAKDKSTPRHGVSYLTELGDDVGYEDAMDEFGIVFAEFKINNRSGQAIRPDKKTLMVVSFQGKNDGIVDIKSLYQATNPNLAPTLRPLLNRNQFRQRDKRGFKGEFFQPHSKAKVVVGMLAPSYWDNERDEYGVYHQTEHYEYFSSKKYKKPMQIAVYGMPVKFNSAGRVSKRADFVWKLHHQVVVWEALVKKYNILTSILAKEPPKLIKYKETIVY